MKRKVIIFISAQKLKLSLIFDFFVLFADSKWGLKAGGCSVVCGSYLVVPILLRVVKSHIVVDVVLVLLVWF